jgi:dihydroorotase
VMISEKRLAELIEIAKRKDWHVHVTDDEVRELISEIVRLRRQTSPYPTVFPVTNNEA